MSDVGKGTSGQVVQATSTGVKYTTATYPSSTTANQLLYSSSTNTIGGLAIGGAGQILSVVAGVPTWVTYSSVIDYIDAVKVSSTANLNATYLNGVAGVGATLVNAGALAAFSIDGQSPAINSRVLVKDQSSTFQNGVYTLTIVGDGSTAWALTRALDYNTPAEINVGDVVPGQTGTVNANTSWLEGATVTTIGTDPITFTQFQSAPLALPVVVANGGTGRTTLTNHGVLVGATTTAITQLAAGSAGQVLQSGGASADPAYSTPTYPSASGSAGKVVVSDGTNNIYSTPTFPNASASSGKFIRSDGTNWIASTPTLPTSAGTSGKILQSDGTNYVESTPTYPSTSGTSGKILISDGTNYIASTPTYPNTSGTSGKVLVSDGTNNVYSTPTFPNASATTRKIIVSDGTNWVASTETYAVPGTSGNIMKSDGTNWTSASPASVGASWTLIQSQNASGSSGLTFTSGITSTYNTYSVVISNFIPSTGANIVIQISTSAGVYIATGYQSGFNSGQYNSTTLSNSNGTTGFLAGACSASTYYCSSMTYLYNVTSGANYVQCSTAGSINQVGVGMSMFYGGGAYDTASQTVIALKVLSSSGTFSGTVSLFGIRET